MKPAAFQAMFSFRKYALYSFIPFLLFLTSCMAPGRAVVLKEINEDPSSGAYIEDVPFYPQDDYMCGPAALASIITFWHRGDATMEEIASGIYRERLKGTLPIDMLLFAKQKGFDVEYYKGSMDDLRARLSEGVPLILFLNLGLKSYPVGHYVVAIGYSDAAKAVLVHSGTKKESTMSYIELERVWSLTDHATLMLRPKAAS